MTDAWADHLNTQVEEALAGPTDVLNRATDRANAQELAERFADQLIWTPEWGWFVWVGTHWAADTARVREIYAGTFADALGARADISENDEERRTFTARFLRLESRAGMAAMLTLAEPMLATRVSELDNDHFKLNCPNGTLNLRTGELRRHDPLDRITKVCPTNYDPDARDAVWDKVLHEALEGDDARLRYVARFAGYTLTGDTSEKKFIVCNGPTNTGKSTVTEALYYTLGSVEDGGYATTWDAEVVQAGAQVNRAEKLNKVRGARMVLIGELERGSRMADNFVKQFTGGDTMDARALYEGSYSYRPQAKLWLATNYVPGSNDPAVQGRLVLLPFEHVPERLDLAVKRHLDEDPQAHSAILAWAVNACRGWVTAGSLGDMPWHVERMASYALSSDTTLQFIETHLKRTDDPALFAPTKQVWAAYNLVWAPQNVHRPLKHRTFDEALQRCGLRRTSGNSGSNAGQWFGWALRDPEEVG